MPWEMRKIAKDHADREQEVVNDPDQIDPEITDRLRAVARNSPDQRRRNRNTTAAEKKF